MTVLDLAVHGHLLLRVLHMAAAAVWVGLSVGLRAGTPGGTDRSPDAVAVRRSLRTGALVSSIFTLAMGWGLFTATYLSSPFVGWGPTDWLISGAGLTPRGIWVLVGALIGHVMAFSLWFIQWPSEQRLDTGPPLDAASREILRARASAVSRWNVSLSFGAIFAMTAGPHLGTGGFWTLGAAIFGVLAWEILFHRFRRIPLGR